MQSDRIAGVEDSETSHMVLLAQRITRETEKLNKYIRDNGLPDPSFSVDAPGDFPNLPDDIQKSRQEIVYATKELGALVRGPRESVRWGVWSVRIYRYRIPAGTVLTISVSRYAESPALELLRDS